MTFLPVVERELRVAARLPGAYRIRLVMAMAALGVSAWILLIPNMSNNTLGQILFASMSGLVNVYAILGFVCTADCLSEEKREGTLGLLFLTDLKGFDIVLGKLAATSLHTFYGMLGIFPIMAISLLVGGVSGVEFWRVVGVSINNLFFSLAVGMFCSSVSRDERKVVVSALLIAAFFVAGMPILGAIVADCFDTKMFEPVFLIPSPAHATIMAFDASRSSADSSWFRYSVAFEALMSVTLLLLACLIVPRTWHDKVQTASSESRRTFWERLRFGSLVARNQRRLRLLQYNPLYWLTNRNRLKNWLVWIFLGVVLLIWILGLIFDSLDWMTGGAYIATGFIVHLVLKFWLAGEACRRFCLDRQSGALELLLSTPLSVREILGGQVMSLARQFGPPVLAVICVDLVFLATNRDSDWTLTWIAGITMLVADLITLSLVSMWLGLNSRGTTRATAAAIVRVLFIPWLVFLGLLTFLLFFGISLARFNLRHNLDFKALVCLWMVFGFANDVFFGLWAARNVHTQFRLAASRRFESGKGQKNSGH